MNVEQNKTFLKVQLCNLRKVVLFCSIVSVAILSFWLTDARCATNFYVAPDFVSSIKDGSASNPWNTVNNDNTWNVINNALASDDVTIFFPRVAHRF